MKNRKVSLGDESPTKPLAEPEPEPEPGDEDDIFEAELLPAYAKTYILPRKMRKCSVSSESGETEEEGGAGVERSRKGGFVRKQSVVTPEFQMSMLRASLEESKMISSLPQVERYPGSVHGSHLCLCHKEPALSKQSVTSTPDTVASLSR